MVQEASGVWTGQTDSRLCSGTAPSGGCFHELLAWRRSDVLCDYLDFFCIAMNLRRNFTPVLKSLS